MNNNELIQGYVELITEVTYAHNQGELEDLYIEHIQLVEKYSGKSWEELKGE